MTKAEDEPNCPECGAAVTVDDGGIFLMGRKTVKCPGCGVELTARPGAVKEVRCPFCDWEPSDMACQSCGKEWVITDLSAQEGAKEKQ